MTRKFSIPFNGTDPDLYIEKMNTYLNNIENIFLGIPTLISNHQNIKIMHGSSVKDILTYEKNCYEFLSKTNGIVKRIVTLNSGFYDFKTDDQLQLFLMTKIVPLVEKYKINGFILTDYNMAVMIHKIYPELELHTSCNCFQWTTRIMNLWKENAGISIFNPPREILRSPEKLKEFKNAGFKLKCIVNESCLYGCPETINHCMALAAENMTLKNCNRNDLANVFRSNWIIPRWLKKLDDYVDIYKISGRLKPTKYIFKTLDAYINEIDDIDLSDILTGGTIGYILDNKIKIPVKDIPDKLLTCECKNCNVDCFVCSNLMQKLNLNGKNI